MKERFILFDFDGVIADSLTVAFEINKMICPDLTDEGYRKRFEGNINDWERVADGHSAKCHHDIHFFTEYIPRMRDRVGITVGIKKVIQHLSESHTLIIVSSTITGPIQKFMEKYNLSPYFLEVMGNDIHTSKIEKIKMILSRYGREPERYVFITDTLGDIREASHVDIGTIGVTWGIHKQETLLKGTPFRVIQKPKDLPLAVSEYFTKPRKSNPIASLVPRLI